MSENAEKGRVLTCKKDFQDLLGISERFFDQFYKQGYIKCKRQNGRYVGFSTVVMKHFEQCMGEGDV